MVGHCSRNNPQEEQDRTYFQSFYFATFLTCIAIPLAQLRMSHAAFPLPGDIDSSLGPLSWHYSPQDVLSTPSACLEHRNDITETQWQQVGIETTSPNPSAHRKKKKIKLPGFLIFPLHAHHHCFTAAELQSQRKERKRLKRQLGNPPSIGFPPHEAIRLLLQWLGKHTSLWLTQHLAGTSCQLFTQTADAGRVIRN